MFRLREQAEKAIGHRHGRGQDNIILDFGPS